MCKFSVGKKRKNVANVIEAISLALVRAVNGHIHNKQSDTKPYADWIAPTSKYCSVL